MNLEQLLGRKAELEAALANTANSWHILKGHLQECAHIIGMLSEKPDEQSDEPVANPDHLPVE